MSVHEAQMNAFMCFYSWWLQARWILSELFVHYHYQGSPPSLTLIDSLSVFQVKSLSYCRVVAFGIMLME